MYFIEKTESAHNAHLQSKEITQLRSHSKHFSNLLCLHLYSLTLLTLSSPELPQAKKNSSSPGCQVLCASLSPGFFSKQAKLASRDILGETIF